MKLPQLRINIKFWIHLLGLAAVIGLFYLFGATFTTALGVYLGYRALRLVLRLFGLFLRVVFTLVSIAVLILIISLIII